MASILELPAALEPTKKKPVKEKRKRKKSSEKETKDTSIMDSKQQCRTSADRGNVQTKIYTTLHLYQEVKTNFHFRDDDFYWAFHQFTLTPEQLLQNGFPLEMPEKPGHVISRCKKYSEDPTSHICARCYEKFHVVNDEYTSTTRCFYHPVRCNSGIYKCCQTNYGTKGCRQCMYHVYSDVDLDNMVFRKIDGKRLVRKDQSHRVYALDCEMVFTTIGMEVAKVGLVDLEGKTVYQTFVVPEHPILDYNTEYSGITVNNLKGVSITLADVQNFLLRTLTKDTILVGHALQNDLRVLRLIHEKIVDTQVVFHEGHYVRKLKALTEVYLKKSIQNTTDGHDSIEDARACMELMLWKIKSDRENAPIVPVQVLKDAASAENVRFMKTDFSRSFFQSSVSFLDGYPYVSCQPHHRGMRRPPHIVYREPGMNVGCLQHTNMKACLLEVL